MPEKVEGIVVDQVPLEGIAEKLAGQHQEKQARLNQLLASRGAAMRQMEILVGEVQKLQGALKQINETAKSFGIDIQEWKLAEAKRRKDAKEANS